MRLIGYIDGVEVNFDFYPPNTFKADIPKRFDGTYIVELRAIDDAGNTASYINKIVKIDFSKLSFKVLEGYTDREHVLRKYNSEEINSRFSFKELQSTAITAKELPSTYTYRELILHDNE